MPPKRNTILLFVCLVLVETSHAQRFHLFSPKMKMEYPSVVYDFLERYLFEIDSLQHRQDVTQRLMDDKVIFIEGTASFARNITEDMPFSLSKVDNKYYEAVWSDSTGNKVLDLAFPMQYELLLGLPKAEIEKTLKNTLSSVNGFTSINPQTDSLLVQEDGCFMTQPSSHYYVESMTTATYLRKQNDGNSPVFDNTDKWHSAANLFQGCIEDIGGYNMYVVQNLYGFKSMQYTISLSQWLGYCQAMKLKTYFAIEEERQDGLKALLIAQSQDLGFNHMLSLIIPDDFTVNRKSMIKCTINAFIPTQNVKDLYQQYVEKKKKKI